MTEVERLEDYLSDISKDIHMKTSTFLKTGILRKKEDNL